LGIAHRKIHASRSHIPTNRKPKKPFPATVKTLGDQIYAARFEKGLDHSEVAQALGISTGLLSLWEKDRATPNQAQMKQLSRLLALQCVTKI